MATYLLEEECIVKGKTHNKLMEICRQLNIPENLADLLEHIAENGEFGVGPKINPEGWLCTPARVE